MVSTIGLSNLYVYLHTVKEFQVFARSTNNSIEHQSFVGTELNCSSVLFFWHSEETLTGTTTPGLGGPGSNVNKGLLPIPHFSKTGALPKDVVWSLYGFFLNMHTYFSLIPPNYFHIQVRLDKSI